MSQRAASNAATTQAAPRDSSTAGGGVMGTINSIVRSVGLVLLLNFAASKFFGGQSPASKVPSFDESQSTNAILQDYSSIPLNIAPLWPANASVDLKIYVSTSLAAPSFNHIPKDRLIADFQNYKLDDSKEKRVIDTEFTLMPEAQNNQTLWAHIYVALHGKELDPASPNYNVHDAYHFFRPLNQFLAKKKVVKTKKLLGGNEEDEAQDESQAPKGAVFASYYHPNISLSFIQNSGVIQYTKLHPAPRSFMNLEATGARDESGKNGWYYPIVFMNSFWQLRDHMTELNSTVKTLPIHIDLTNMAYWKFNMMSSIDENIKSNQRAIANGASGPAGGDGSEFEEIKRVLIDTNIYLLSTTAIVTVLHMFFEMLAFKNDVTHWRTKKDNVGVSVRTILANVVMQTIIMLYLIDNSDGTSWMILFGQGVGIFVEAWKITKTVDVRVRAAPAGSVIPYRVSFEDKHKLSETEKKTQEYDAIAFRYLYMVAIPLLLAYTVYSVLYDEHKGWYSFIITTLVGSVYAYGFLMMVPSLYINYRLKSVAHMPGRAMTYKFLNTFIDDLFAFTIKMPTLHRLATLRDDVIFFIYIYQTYKYKVDYNRVNEFGQGGDEEEVEEKIANKPLVAPADSDASVKLPVTDVETISAKASGKEEPVSTKDVKKRK